MATLNIGPKKLIKEYIPPETTFKEVITNTEYVSVEKIVEVIKEVPTFIDREVQVIKEVPTFIDREIQIIKEVPKTVEVFVEKVIIQEIKHIPKWIWGIIVIEFLIILFK